MTDVTIIMPSRNGADTLPLCLDALAKVDRAGLDVEILLIDNASTDETPQLMQRFADSHGAKVLSVDTPGKSYALNHGIDEAQGALIVFLDDDTIPCRDILHAYREASTTYPECNVFIGRVTPFWLGEPPEWLETIVAQGLTLGGTPETLTDDSVDPRNLKGANFAARLAAARETKFDTGKANWGVGKNRQGGEDTDFALRATDNGRRELHYVRQASAGHIIQPHEMKLKAILSRKVVDTRNYMSVASNEFRNRPISATKVPTFLAFAGLTYAFNRKDKAARWLIKAATQIGRL